MSADPTPRPRHSFTTNVSTVPRCACHWSCPCVQYLYTIRPDGSLLISVQGTPDANLPHFPRLGLVLTIPQELGSVSWYGRGPHESYSDMKESALIGIWQDDVDNMFQPNIRPQECGNHEDMRWASFTDGKGSPVLSS